MRQIIARVRELVAGIWKEAKVEMYGSFYTGVFTRRLSWRSKGFVDMIVSKASRSLV